LSVPCLEPLFAMLLWSRTSTTARPLSSTPCSALRGCSRRTRSVSTESWTPTIRSANGASPSSPRRLPSSGREPRSTLSTPRVTPTSPVRWSGRWRWWTGCFFWSTQQRDRCRRPDMFCQRHWPFTCRQSLSSTRWTAPTPGSLRWSMRYISCSSISMRQMSTSSSKSSPVWLVMGGRFRVSAYPRPTLISALCSMPSSTRFLDLPAIRMLLSGHWSPTWTPLTTWAVWRSVVSWRARSEVENGLPCVTPTSRSLLCGDVSPS